MQSTVIRLAGVLALASLAGCSTLSSLNPFKKSVPRNPPSALVDFKPTLSARAVWTTTIGSAKGFTFTPASAGGSVFVAAADGSVARIDSASGQTTWRINAGEALSAGVGTDGNTVAVAGSKGRVFAFDADGKPRWQAQMSSEVLSAPAVTADLVIVRSIDNRISAFDVATGSKRWSLQRPTPALTLRTAPGIVTSATTAFAALPGGRLLAISLANGAPLWEAVVGDPRGTTELERISDTSGSPLLLGNEICAVAYQGRIACFDAGTGTARWAKAWSSDVGVDADDKLLFTSSESGSLAAFARDSGAGVWRNSQLSYRVLSAPVVLGRAVVVGDGQGVIHFLSRDDGSFLARASTDGSPILAAPVVAANRVIFQTQAGQLVALATE